MSTILQSRQVAPIKKKGHTKRCRLEIKYTRGLDQATTKASTILLARKPINNLVFLNQI